MTGVACIGACHVDVKAVVGGPVVLGTSNPATVTSTPGGVACNIARWLARLGTPVTLHSMVGDDQSGRELVERLAHEGIGVEGIGVLSGARTASYTAVLDGRGALVVGVADMAIYERMDVAWAETVIPRDPSSVMVIDANPSAGAIRAVATAKGSRTLVADPVSVEKSSRLLPALAGIDAVFPDRAEAEVLGGVDDPVSAAAAIVRRGAALAVVTLGGDGVVVVDGAGSTGRPAVVPRAVVDVTGAGDALVAGYVHALVAGEADPVGWGLAAASLAVETVETVPDGVTSDEVRVRMAG